MRDTTLTIQRGVNTATVTDLASRLATGISAQIDEVDGTLQTIHGEVTIFEEGIDFKLIVAWNPNALIRKGDTLLDERYVDVTTGMQYQYLVTRRPKDYQFSHQECYCKVVEGS